MHLIRGRLSVIAWCGSLPKMVKILRSKFANDRERKQKQILESGVVYGHYCSYAISSKGSFTYEAS